MKLKFGVRPSESSEALYLQLSADHENGSRRSDDEVSFWSDPFGVSDLRHFRREFGPLSIAVLAYCFGVYVNSYSQAWLQKYLANEYAESSVLWDVGYKNLPKLDIVFFDVTFMNKRLQLTGPDFVAGLASAYMTFRFVILPGPLSMRFTILRRILFLSGVMFFFRAFSIVSTVLPNPDSNCVCTLDDKPCVEKDLENLWLFAWQIFQMRAVTCVDVLFSGHTVALTMSILFVLEYSCKSPWFPDFTWPCLRATTIRFGCYGFSIAGYVVIIASRFHYTADVLLGFLLTVLVFKGYHHAIKDAFNGDTPWKRFLNWFESYALDVKVWRIMSAKRLREKTQHLTISEDGCDPKESILAIVRTDSIGSFADVTLRRVRKL